MPGSFIIRPIEANLTHNTDLLGRMNPYCAVTVGSTKIKGQICKKGGKHPHWNDAITVPVTGESKVLVELMDKDKITRDDNIGSFVLDLNEVQASGQVSRWYPLTHKNKAAGEILLEAVFQPEGGMTGMTSSTGMAGAGIAGATGMATSTGMAGMAGSQYTQDQYGAISGENQYYAQEQQMQATQPAIIEEQTVTTTTTTTQPAGFVQQATASADASFQSHSHVWTEQRQVVEPHTFVKEIDVVETRPVLKEVEVMEPVKVVKDVQYTQAVPVVKQIEVVEPQVVVKEVEVIEPRLVTKTIQVVENVPVKKQVEVVEMRNAIQEVQTFEPQTFHKQVEVTEFQPARRQVEVTQPVTVKKAVEFVEPVITTQYITKAVQEPVIVDEKITTEVGPASVIGWLSQYTWYQQPYASYSLEERQRLSGLQRWVGYETIFSGLTEEERFWEQQRLSRLSEQEWLRERERLMGFNEKDRLREQRGFFSQLAQAFKDMTYKPQPQDYQRAAGISSGYTQPGVSSTGMSGLGGQPQALDLGQKLSAGHNSAYNPSPNF